MGVSILLAAYYVASVPGCLLGGERARNFSIHPIYLDFTVNRWYDEDILVLKEGGSVSWQTLFLAGNAYIFQQYIKN